MPPSNGRKAFGGWCKKIYPQATRITLVMDNLNTHGGASLYKAFPPHVACSLLDKLACVYTPKHGLAQPGRM